MPNGSSSAVAHLNPSAQVFWDLLAGYMGDQWIMNLDIEVEQGGRGGKHALREVVNQLLPSLTGVAGDDKEGGRGAVVPGVIVLHQEVVELLAEWVIEDYLASGRGR